MTNNRLEQLEDTRDIHQAYFTQLYELMHTQCTTPLSSYCDKLIEIYNEEQAQYGGYEEQYALAKLGEHPVVKVRR